jgi:DNA-binding PadR family transcriptional regulator
MAAASHRSVKTAHAGLGELGFQILVALGDGPAHGYAIGKELEAKSGGRLNPTTGTLYQALKRLMAAGLIERSGASSAGGDARRKVFALTRAGGRAVAEEARRLEEMVQAARRKNLYPASR